MRTSFRENINKIVIEISGSEMIEILNDFGLETVGLSLIVQDLEIPTLTT